MVTNNMSMKKFIYSLFAGALTLSMVSCMGIDNFDEPDCRFTGRIIDATTGQNILADQAEYRVRIWEKSFSTNPAPQDIPVKQDGEFNNNKLFAGTYDVVPEGAFWPCDTIRVGIGKTVTQNFEVTPYLTLIDFHTELNGTSLTMSCRMDAPIKDGLPQINEIRPFLSLNQYCGGANHIDHYFSNSYRIGILKTWDKLDKDPDGKSTTYSFTVTVKPGYTYFVRMGARVKDTRENYNYTEIVKIEVPN